MLDMFSGSHTPYILERFPHFKIALDGFTLFPNSISGANATIYAMPSIIGGEHYTIYNMNARGENHALAEAQAYKDIGLAFANALYEPSFLMYGIAKRDLLIAESKLFWFDNYEPFRQYFLSKHPHLERLLDDAKHYDLVKMLSFGVFKFAPKIFRKNIYNDGLWLQQQGKIDKNSVITHIAPFYANTHIVNANANKATFKFIHSNMTHAPFGIYFNGTECEYLQNNTIWENTNPHIHSMKKGRYSYQHFDTEICALQYLTYYIEILKKLNIYDNTQIFIVSDHAGDDSFNMPRLVPRAIGADTLFLFKDFNAKGALKIDNRLVANYDIASIFCANLPNGCPKVSKNILQHYPKNRKIIHARPGDDFNIHKPNLWFIQRAYKVSKSIYGAENWADVSDLENGIVNAKK
ncbi:sulfatase-like hydrolase/transferase [Helicobacter sp. 23-1044]